MTYPPGTILEIDGWDEIENEPTGTFEWIVRLPLDAACRQTPDDFPESDDPDNERVPDLHEWVSLHTRETFPDDDIDLTDARIIAVPIAETAARMLMDSRVLETPDAITAAVWSNLSRGPEFRAAVLEANRLIGELRGHDVSKASQPVHDALLAATDALEYLRTVVSES